MLRLCCCPCRAAAAVTPSLAPALRPSDLKLDLVADLPPLAWDSSNQKVAAVAAKAYDEIDSLKVAENVETNENDDEEAIVAKQTPENIPVADEPSRHDTPGEQRRRSPSLHRSPSVCVEDYSERSSSSLVNDEVPDESPTRRSAASDSGEFTPSKLAEIEIYGSSGQRSPGPAGSVGESAESPRSKGRASPAGNSRHGARTPTTALTPSPPSQLRSDERAPRGTRDVRNALAECIVPPRHEDWEAILTGLLETERLAVEPEARASPTSWRAAVRATTAHVRSLRSRVARAACGTLGALYEHRGRILEPELEEAAAALLERCADANRFLRADASAALARVACGGSSARAAMALCRRGAAHRAGPVRAAAAAALARLVEREGATRALALPIEARAALLRAAGDLLEDASPEARVHARALCLTLSEDTRFRPLLKEVMPPTRYRSVEKLVDKLRYR